MYTLRTFQGQIQHNESLGNEYHVVHRETSYDDFCVAYKTFFGQGHVADLDSESDDYSKNVYGFVVYERGSKLMPLYKGKTYYIMTPQGSTFDNLTYK